MDAPYNVTLGFTYNPAGQIVGRTLSNPAYAHGVGAGTTTYVNNGRNQVTAVNGAGVTYDARHNLTGAPGLPAYGHDTLSRLTSAGSVSLSYDPAGRLSQTTGAATTRFLYDGLQAIGEYDGSGALIRRHVPGLGLDSTLVSYEGATFDRRWLLTDERGSVITLSNNAGAVTALNTYDEYGVPGPGNAGRFQYTGQMWLPEAQAYHYRARAYAPQLGRFLQTDPIGYGDGLNLYGYVGGDPVNWTDPLGLWQAHQIDDVIVNGIRRGGNGTGSTTMSEGECTRFGGNALTNHDTLMPGIVCSPVRNVSNITKTCTAGQVAVTKTGQRVAMSASIDFPDGETFPYMNDIQSAWSGLFGSYSVSLDLNINTGGIVANISFGPGGRPRAELGGSNMYLNTLVGATPSQSAYSRWAAGHEFGHILGLGDQYTDAAGANAGYENEIMGAYGGVPNEDTINSILGSCS